MARIIASIEKMEQRTNGTNKKRKHATPENPVQESEKNPALNRSKETLEKQAQKKKKKTDITKVNKKVIEEENKKEKSEARARPRRRFPMRKRKGIKLPPKKYWLKQYKSDIAKSITISMPKPKQMSIPCEPEPVHGLHGAVSSSPSPTACDNSHDVVRQLLSECVEKIEVEERFSAKKQFRPVLKSLEILSSTGDSFMSPQPTTGLWQQHTVVNPERRDGSENSSKVAIVEQHTALRARNLNDSPTADNVKSFDSSTTQPLSIEQ